MKIALLALFALASSAHAQSNGVVAPQAAAVPSEPGAIPLYGAGTPGSANSEVWSSIAPGILGVRNVTRPTLTPVLPDPTRANGAAVIVIPGGAFMALAIDHEGWQVARALASRGIAAFVLKYRLLETPREDAEAAQFMATMMKRDGAAMDGELLRRSKAPEDARAAIALVRARAAEWRIDPARVGVIGFSAGAMTSRRIGIDAPPAERPNFVGYIYGPQEAEAVPADAPPLFDAIALDDRIFPSNGFPIAAAWLAARRPVEIHGYQSGDHGFGLGRPGTTAALLIDEFTAWLDMQGFLKVKDSK